MRIRGVLAATTTLLACALFPVGATAYDGEQNRMRTGAGAGGTPAQSADQPYDASYAHQWEANPPKGFPTLAAENIAATRAAIGRYTEIAQRGGWPMLRDALLQPGSGGPAVEVLRRRLLISGDLKSPGTNGGYFPVPVVYDAAVEKAVKRFQASNGLTPTGIVDQRTLAALNIPAEVRLRQLQVNLARLEELTRGTPKRYVVVNIPAAQIEAVENDRVVSRHAGVVGKIDRQTPLLKSAIHELNFNPVWHLPPTVITKDLVPKGRDMQAQGKDVLAKYHIEAFTADGKKLDTAKINWSNLAVANLTYRQQPG
ncbi:MAG: peptidoglycan-binding protein, partial [Proteobacteria bacterium]|nr:peptidoglycan-binding protein [Pseudomonadota bacterium]